MLISSQCHLNEILVTCYVRWISLLLFNVLHTFSNKKKEIWNKTRNPIKFIATYVLLNDFHFYHGKCSLYASIHLVIWIYLVLCVCVLWGALLNGVKYKWNLSPIGSHLTTIYECTVKKCRTAQQFLKIFLWLVEIINKKESLNLKKLIGKIFSTVQYYTFKM